MTHQQQQKNPQTREERAKQEANEWVSALLFLVLCYMLAYYFLANFLSDQMTPPPSTTTTTEQNHDTN